MPGFATVGDVFDTTWAEAGVGGVAIDGRQDVPAAFAFVAFGFLTVTLSASPGSRVTAEVMKRKRSSSPRRARFW